MFIYISNRQLFFSPSGLYNLRVLSLNGWLEVQLSMESHNLLRVLRIFLHAESTSNVTGVVLGFSNKIMDLGWSWDASSGDGLEHI